MTWGVRKLAILAMITVNIASSRFPRKPFVKG